MSAPAPGDSAPTHCCPTPAGDQDHYRGAWRSCLVEGQPLPEHAFVPHRQPQGVEDVVAGRLLLSRQREGGDESAQRHRESLAHRASRAEEREAGVVAHQRAANAQEHVVPVHARRVPIRRHPLYLKSQETNQREAPYAPRVRGPGPACKTFLRPKACKAPHPRLSGADLRQTAPGLSLLSFSRLPKTLPHPALDPWPRAVHRLPHALLRHTSAAVLL